MHNKAQNDLDFSVDMTYRLTSSTKKQENEFPKGLKYREISPQYFIIFVKNNDLISRDFFNH